MINRLSYFISSSTNPYLNLAVEEYLLETVKPNQLILYLWQNERTVVIGKNQNAWKECRFQELEADGGHLARRLSGGGAVFHDLGNLNFTFLMPSSDYDLSKQMSVILEAVRSLGIDAQKSGRNDVTVDGKKFSGNAFCQKGTNSYHHGTLMLRVDTQKVARYLNVSEKKLRSKGVSSVTSRVCNLCDFIPDLTREQMQQELLKALSDVYGFEPEAMDDQNFDTIPPGIGCMDAKFPSPGCGKTVLTGEKYSFSSTSTTASSKMLLFILILWTNASSKESHPV